MPTWSMARTPGAEASDTGGSFGKGRASRYRCSLTTSSWRLPVAAPVLVAGARTPIGKLAGALKGFTAMDLGGIAIKGALERAGLTGDQVDKVIMGHVIQAGQGQITARQAAVKGGIPMTVPALTVNSVCLSGLEAIAMAAQAIRAGDAEIVVAGGMESMTNAPHVLPGSRAGLQVRQRHPAGLDGPRRPVLRVRPGRDGREHRELRQEAGHQPRGAGRVLGPQPRARRVGHEGGPLRRRDRPGRDPAAQGRPRAGHRGRGRAPRHHRRDAGQAPPGLRRRRHHLAPARPRRSPTAPAPSSS